MSKQIFMTPAQIRKATKPKPKFVAPVGLKVSQIAQFKEARSTVITIPCLPPSKNEYMRLHWGSQQRRYFKPWEAMMSSVLAHCVKHVGPVEVEIELHFPDKRERDTLNYTAFPPLMDSLKRAGLIEDDNSQICRVVNADPIIDGTRQTVIRIRRVEG